MDAAALGVPEAPIRLNGGNLCRWEAEVYPGDELERCTEVDDVWSKHGSTGLLLFYRLASTYRRFHSHEIVARSISTTVRRYPSAGDQGLARRRKEGTREAPPPNVLDARAALQVIPTSRALVQYAAATDDFYEAHYDYAFARGAGLPGVITHGLLKLAYFATAAAGLGRPSFAVREVSATYRGTDLVAQPFTVLARQGEGNDPASDAEQHWDLYGVSATGAVTTEGHAITVPCLGRQRQLG